MASEELADAKEWHVLMNWRNEQKEEERERRRIRDRLRRQTMSNEEREKHLARRRRNYQLRRQKVLNHSSFSISQICDSTTSAGVEERRYKLQRSPNILPLHQIRHLARLLNSLSSDDQEIGTHLMSKDNVNTESRSRQCIRFIDARALNANGRLFSNFFHVDFART